MWPARKNSLFIFLVANSNSSKSCSLSVSQWHHFHFVHYLKNFQSIFMRMVGFHSVQKWLDFSAKKKQQRLLFDTRRFQTLMCTNSALCAGTPMSSRTVWRCRAWAGAVSTSPWSSSPRPRSTAGPTPSGADCEPVWGGRPWPRSSTRRGRGRVPPGGSSPASTSGTLATTTRGSPEGGQSQLWSYSSHESIDVLLNLSTYCMTNNVLVIRNRAPQSPGWPN